MARIVRSPLAKRDLAEIWNYIDNVDAADRLVLKIDGIFQMLSDGPLLGRLRDDIAEEVRSFPANNYLVLYKPISRGVEIVRVVHGRRNLKRIRFGVSS